MLSDELRKISLKLIKSYSLHQQYSPMSMDEEAEIREWMSTHEASYIDGIKLAEDCAKALGHEEWIEDQKHQIWHIALEFIDER